MATPAEYTIAANAIVPVLNSDFNTLIPSWARGMIPANEAQVLAGALAKAAVDALDAHRARQILDLDFPEIPPIAQGKIS